MELGLDGQLVRRRGQWECCWGWAPLHTCPRGEGRGRSWREGGAVALMRGGEVGVRRGRHGEGEELPG